MTAPLDLAALRALPRDVFPACEKLNHETADYHAAGEQCPVAVRVRAALDQIPALLAELGGLRADAARLDWLDTCDVRLLTDVIALSADGNAVRRTIDRARGEGR